ncbi:MAG: hypothetical protein Q4C83_01585 [Candidatus Saccharibacteria bacterium]|nr:hypothetical protein [Candidatus Saccharibacteria bacterium]
MMISPESYIDEIRDKSYKQLLKEKRRLIKEIDEFENSSRQEEIIVLPSPETIYLCNLEYLAELCKLIAEKYGEKHVNGNF